jgi:hypothetical protein
MGFGKTEDKNQEIIQQCFRSHYHDCPNPTDGGEAYQQKWGLRSIPFFPNLRPPPTDEGNLSAMFLDASSSC